MSSQNLMKNPKVVIWSLFALRWIFLLSFIYTLYQNYLKYSPLNLIIALIFAYYTGQFFILEKAFHKQRLNDEVEKYNETIEEINSKPRWQRRAIIRNLKK